MIELLLRFAFLDGRDCGSKYKSSADWYEKQGKEILDKIIEEYEQEKDRKHISDGTEPEINFKRAIQDESV